MSLDALRGFDMFWILGADSFVAALHQFSKNPVADVVATQMDHVEWQGFHFYDLIFPLFVFIMGVSTVFSLEKIIAREGKSAAVKRVLVRGLLLFLIALFYSGGFTNPWPDMRLMGVLNRIALCYTFGGLLFIYCNTRVMIAAAVALLLGYWAMLEKIPMRDIHLQKDALVALAEKNGNADLAKQFREMSTNPGKNPSGIKDSPLWQEIRKEYFATETRVTGKYEMGYNIANHFDFEHLPARRYDIFWDPEGLLSTIPAFVTGLLGIFTGLYLRHSRAEDMRKVLTLFAAGAGCAALGALWGMEMPIIKKIWTSSYVLVAGGFSLMLLALFYFMVDVKKWRWWCQPFVWIGMNPITLYLASNFMGGGGFLKLARRLAGGPVKQFFDTYIATGAGEMMISFVGVLLFVWFARFLYQRQIFLRL